MSSLQSPLPINPKVKYFFFLTCLLLTSLLVPRCRISSDASSPSPAVMSCGDEGCGARDPWPLHHVRHRGLLCRLCTSCVLKYHPGSFCTICFDLLDDTSNAVIHCARCPASVHASCFSVNPNAVEFVCPPCVTGPDPATYSYFALDFDQDGRRRLDPSSAKILLIATRLAANSMNRAAAAARADAERKAREAAVAKKRAREMLERVISLSCNCKIEHQQPPPQPMKAEVKVEADTEIQRCRLPPMSRSGERESLMRFVGPIRSNQPNSYLNNFRQDGEKNGKALETTQSQDSSVSRSARAVFTVAPSTASLHC